MKMEITSVKKIAHWCLICLGVQSIPEMSWKILTLPINKFIDEEQYLVAIYLKKIDTIFQNKNIRCRDPLSVQNESEPFLQISPWPCLNIKTVFFSGMGISII